MIVLNELTGKGMRRLELWPDDVVGVSNIPGASSGSEIETIDCRRFYVAEGVAEVYERLESDDASDEGF